MAQVVLGAVGGAVGGGVGRAIGGLVGGMVDDAVIGALAPARQRGPRLESLKVQGTAEGAPVPCVFGRMRVAGQVIWAARFLEKRNERGGGKGGPRTVDYEYTLSFAVALGEGPIDGIGRVWADGQPFDRSGVTMRVYRGTEDQTPDPLIEAVEGATSAYRGTAYVVFEDLPLGPFGNRPPQLSFEVFRRPRGEAARLEDLLEGVCLIPGAGEFALATQAVMRREGLTRTKAENVNNLEGRPDIGVSLDQLEATFPNLKRVSLVVGWFGDSLDAGVCRVRPGVERVDKPTEPMTWSVAGLARNEAHLISEVDGGPAYGGTPDDESVRQAIVALKARGWAVTLYPFVFMDCEGYPWRGRITAPDGAGAVAAVSNVFGAAAGWGLRRMARHYAALAAECGADGLLIGSEMRGVTTIRDASGAYPATAELKALAAECRAVVGPDVEISYAADWSEYFGHQPSDGAGDVAFHLDPLWADANVDYVGIDWYPPMGDWRDGGGHLDALAGYAGAADAAYLADQMAGGAQFDWFYADDDAREVQARSPITDGAYGEPWVFRPKDLKGWWSNAHHDRPGGVRSSTPTDWVAGMKPIRLTEFGCAAVDNGGNAPNLFQDPKSSESHLPPYSSGGRDDRMQRRLLEAVIGHYGAAENNPVSAVYGGPMLAGMDAWCWDARPYPDFPARAEVWADAGNWRAGHWLNGRGFGEGADLVAAILKRGGLGEGDFAVEGVGDGVEGYVIDRPMRTRDALGPLMLALDLTASERGGVVTVSGGREAGLTIGAQALALPDRGAGVEVARTLEAPPETVRARFVDAEGDYRTGAVVERGAATGGGEAAIDLPLACAPGLARAAGARMLAASVNALSVALGPLEALRLEAGDAVAVEGRAGVWRVERAELDETPKLTLRPVGEAVQVEPGEGPRPGPAPEAAAAPLFRLLDLPPLPGSEADGRPLAAVAADPWRAMAVHAGAEVEVLRERGQAVRPATVGRLAEALAPGRAWRWDETSALVVDWEGLAPSSISADAVLAGANALAVETEGGWEIVQFRSAVAEPGGRWRLSGLLRGRQGTEGEAGLGAEAGATVVVLDGALVRLDMAPGERGLPMIWRAGPAGAPPGGVMFSEIEAGWTGVHDRPWAPARLKAESAPDGVRLSWIARNRMDGDRWDGEAGLSDPLRFRVRVLDGAIEVRRWEVEENDSLYPAAQRAADLPGGGGRVAVSQWSPAFGWGAEAERSLP